MSRKVVAAVSDMFFAAKMQTAARHAGVELTFAASTEDLLEKVRAAPDLVVIDLNDSSVDALGAIEKLRAEPRTRALPLLAFLSHVQTELAARARAAGCEQVIPRSQFSARLVEILRG